MVNLSATERLAFEAAAEARKGSEFVEAQSYKMSAKHLERTKKVYKIMTDALDTVVLPVLRRFMVVQLQEFHRDVVVPAAAAWGMSAEDFTDETLDEYRQLMEAELKAKPRWNFIPQSGPERAKLLAICKSEGAWRRTAVLVLNFEQFALVPPSLWDETALCAAAEGISRYLRGKGLEELSLLIWHRDRSIRQVNDSVFKPHAHAEKCTCRKLRPFFFCSGAKPRERSR